MTSSPEQERCQPWEKYSGWQGFLTTLFNAKWSSKGYDSRLYRSLLFAAHEIGLVELHCYFSDRKVLISVRDPTKELLITESHEQLATPSRQKATLLESSQRHVAVSVTIDRERHVATKKDPPPNTSSVVTGVFALNDSPRSDGTDHLAGEESRFVHGSATTLLYVIGEVLRQRMRRMASLPDKLSTRYWDDSVHVVRQPSETPPPTEEPARLLLSPPWDSGNVVPTATLSLDLRKSTLCMEQAFEGAFAPWIQEFVDSLTMVAHRHGGIFDKFTGDGCLVHFLERDTSEVFDNSAVDAAVQCAAQMQETVELLLERLRPNLQHYSRLFGAGIGIAFGDTEWSLDQSDNIVVVGRPVVEACRLCGKAKAREILLANGAFAKLNEDLQAGFSQAEVVTKELNADLEMVCYSQEFESQPERRSRADEVVEIVTTVGYGSY